jgi:hypothetical protein
MSGSRPVGVCAILDTARPARPVLELRGPVDPVAFHRAVHRIAESHPARRLAPPRLLRHGPGRHTVHLPELPELPQLPGPAAGQGAAAPYPVGLLADLLTAAPPADDDGAGPGRGAGGAGGRHCGTLPRTLAPTPLQRERLAGALARPGHHVEQLAWRWHGPLDGARFAAAWQAVTDRESVLRTAFVWDPRPRAVVFEQGLAQVRRHTCASAGQRAAARARERAYGFDLRRPALLRVALLEGAASFTEVLITYHRALLDNWSVRLLMQECCRAYLGGGLPGGERRPDLGDCTRWLHGQDLAPARDFWHTPTPPAPAASAPAGQPYTTTGGSGSGSGSGGGGGVTGVHRTALTRAESVRLARWAARWGATESSALQTVWALLLYRATRAAPAPARVGFGLAFPGRGLLLEGVERTPGPFENALPMTVALDAAATVAALLRELRDRALDMAAYEWVAPGDLTPHPPAAGAGTLLAFDCGPRPEESLAPALADQGVRVERQDLIGALTGYALAVRAGHDARRGLVLTCAYDPQLVDGDAARTLLAQSAHLLRLLPCAARRHTTVADALALLGGAALPRLPAAPAPQPAPAAAVLVLLRPATGPAACTVCIVDAPGARPGAHHELLRHYRGPSALSALRTTPDATPDAGAGALAALARFGDRLVLGGYSGAGATACELARRLTAHGARPPLVVIAGAGEDGPAARDLARALHEAGA